MDKRELLLSYLESNKIKNSENYQAIRDLFKESLTEDLKSKLEFSDRLELINLLDKVICFLIVSDFASRVQLIEIAFSNDSKPDIENNLSNDIEFNEDVSQHGYRY